MLYPTDLIQTVFLLPVRVMIEVTIKFCKIFAIASNREFRTRVGFDPMPRTQHSGH